MKMPRSSALALLATAPVAATAQQLSPLRFIGLPIDGCKAVFYGVRSGIFRRHGLDVQTSLMNSGPAASAALIGGSADIALSNIATLLLAYDRGVGMRAISAGGLYRSAESREVLITNKDGPIRTAADLAGKAVGSVSLGGIALVGIRAWLNNNGGDAKAVSIIESPESAMIAMLDQGRIAAAVANEPLVSSALATGRFRILGKPYDAIGLRFQTAAYVVMEQSVLKDPEPYRRFAVALHEAQVYTNSHEADTVDLVASYTNIPAEIIAQSARVPDLEYLEEPNIRPVIDALLREGQLSRRFPATAVFSSVALAPPRPR